MDSTSAESPSSRGHPAGNRRLPEFVDWFLGAIIVLSGLISIVGGSALAFLVDRDTLADGIEEGTITVTAGTTELTDAEQLEVAQAVVSWTGIGLLVTGLGLVLFGGGYVIMRHRTHRWAEPEERSNTYGMFAILGAVATALLSFLPISPALGGALAGYLERSESDRTVSVGALAGFLPMIPLFAILVFVLGGLIAGMLTIGQGGMAIVLGATLFLTLMLIGTVGAGLGALGGYVGGRLADRRVTTD